MRYLLVCLVEDAGHLLQHATRHTKGSMTSIGATRNMKQSNDLTALATSAAKAHANYLAAKHKRSLAKAAAERADAEYVEAVTAARAAKEAFAKATTEVP